MVRSYVNDNIEINKFKEHINESNKLIDYHNKCIKELKNTIEIYSKIINNLEIEILINNSKIK